MSVQLNICPVASLLLCDLLQCEQVKTLEVCEHTAAAPTTAYKVQGSTQLYLWALSRQQPLS
jgi:hypothetical protein